MNAYDKIFWALKPIIWVLCMLPLAWLSWLILNQGLTANPTEFVNRYLGEWAIRILWVALAVTPVKILTGWKQVARFRRLIGLFAFFYVVLHVASYVVVDQYFDWIAIWNDIVKRVYITVGMTSLLILVALAATSWSFMVRRLGGKAWNRLHQSVYLAGIMAAIHFVMMRKGFQIEPLIYAGILAALLGARLVPHLIKLKKRTSAIWRACRA